MLKRLSVRNYAVVDDVTVEFAPGLTVLSGETGAGKSILIDALGLLIGERADSQAVRPGCPRAEIEAEFDLADAPRARAWLEQRALDDADAPQTLNLRRVIGADGQGRASINGSPAPVKRLRELGALLVGIHGQQAHQALLGSGSQRDLLDGYGELQDSRATVAAAADELGEIEALLSELQTGDGGPDERLELLRYQHAELEQLAPEADEFAQLDTECRRLDHAEQLLADCAMASNLLYEQDGSAYELVSQSLARLGEAGDLDPVLAEAGSLCEQAQIAIREAADQVLARMDHIAPDPERLETVRRRLDRMQDLARKHRTDPAGLPELQHTLAAEIERLEQSARSREELDARRESALQRWQRAAAALHAARVETAARLARDVNETLRPLGLPHAEFSVEVQALEDARPRPHGADQVEFRVTMNPGQPAGPLNRVASGGELSRTSLALQVVCLNQSPVPVLLFDEVDAGIGGGVAETVGRRLRQLGERYQVLCVTHQPQVAALGHGHLVVSKSVDAGQTRTAVRGVDGADRIAELARMLGGVEITAQTTRHARELLERAGA